jgi:hypothetical protein
MNLIDEPLLTSIVSRQDLSLAPDSTYLFGTGVEDRSILESEWRNAMEQQGVRFVTVEEDADSIILGDSAGTRLEFTGRQRSKALEFLELDTPIYLDMTGMTYVAWAPLVRVLVESGAQLQVVYVEPVDYKRSSTPTRGMLFDLSEGFDGLRPIPGFAAIGNQDRADWHLVAALGFEGSRFSHLMSELEPASDQVIPIVGVPGFRPEFATQAFVANRADLDDLVMATQVRFARANCPFDFFHTLLRVHDDIDGGPLRLAPIGTKPHGLGAVLFTMSRASQVQLIYDHPRRKAKRSLGASRVCVYDVSTFCESDLFRDVRRENA